MRRWIGSRRRGRETPARRPRTTGCERSQRCRARSICRSWHRSRLRGTGSFCARSESRSWLIFALTGSFGRYVLYSFAFLLLERGTLGHYTLEFEGARPITSREEPVGMAAVHAHSVGL